MSARDAFTARRLLVALEDMAERESVLLRAGELDHVLELQKRMEPLVATLCELAPTVADDDMRSTALRLLDVRQKNHQRLGHELNRLNREREKVKRTRVQLIRLKPAYSGSTSRRVFQAQG